jgi:hypothetical protein
MKHGKAYFEAKLELNKAPLYSETHEMAYIDNFKNSYLNILTKNIRKK